ncbi:CD109 antigen-like isoform X2 [Corticium candelabrum]|uniref:CD109 antigen-like isoform X2 n=1 Tax=Corticium candelabrum TaxID=121492 RepID=UPI002E267590|nr:CD109 antigen-like isoform X2 [Corticium candelabrum]
METEDDGRAYRGTTSTTTSGRLCQSWQSQSPHKHSFFPKRYPEVKKAKNTCRNPGGLKSKPWCYTQDPKMETETCALAPCSKSKSESVMVLYRDGNEVGVETHTIQSPLYSQETRICFSFLYWVNSADMKLLTVRVLGVDDVVKSELDIDGTISDKWYWGYIRIPDGIDFRVQLSGNIDSNQTNAAVLAVDMFGYSSCSEALDCVREQAIRCNLERHSRNGSWDLLFSTIGIGTPEDLFREIDSDLSIRYQSKGCWEAGKSNDMPSLEDKAGLLRDYPHQRKFPILSCARAARAFGFRVFALKAGGQCYSSENAETLYLQYRRSDRCLEAGTGGKTAYEVYVILSADVGGSVNNLKSNKGISKQKRVSFFVYTINNRVYDSDSYLKFNIVPDHDKGYTCIWFRYREMVFPNTRVVVTDVMVSGEERERTRTVFTIPKKRRSKNKWYSASISIPLLDRRTAMHEILIKPEDPQSSGNLLIQDLKTIPCQSAMNCTFDEETSCNWNEKTSSALFYWVVVTHVGVSGLRYLPRNATGQGYSGYITFARSFLATKLGEKTFEYIESPILPFENYRCMAFHYAMDPFMQGPEDWGFSIQALISGKIKSRKLLQGPLGKWILATISLPASPRNLMQIRFEVCQLCRIALDNIIFSKQSCGADEDECVDKELNDCEQNCLNTFGSYECYCKFGYQVATDGRQCDPICSRVKCQNGGVCVAPNKCACAKGFAGQDCTLSCGPPILTNSSGTIVSSNYGKVLRRVEVVCNWEIQAHSGQIIALEFEGLDLGYQPCQHSNVLVQNVLDDNVTQTSIPQEMRRICPQTRPPAILSSGNRLFITFTSTSRFGYRGTGMKAKYKIHDKRCYVDCSKLEWWQKCCEGHVIVTSNVLRSGTQSGIHVMLHGVKGRVDMEAALTSSGSEYILPTRLQIQGSGNGTVHGSMLFNIPEDLSTGTYQLKLTGSVDNRPSFRHSVTVAVAARGPTVFVQTDKPAYRMGETVRIRLISLDYTGGPHRGLLAVVISDGRGTKILQWQNLRPKNGLISRSLALSTQAVSGQWNISVRATYPDGKEALVQTACFDVGYYDIPKYDVQLSIPSYVIQGGGNITGVVEARYIYGKPVRGELCLDFKSNHRKQFYTVYFPSVLRFCQPIVGLHDFSIDSYSLIETWFERNEYYWPTSLEVNATVTEHATGARVLASEEVFVSPHPYVLSFEGTPNSYRPGLPVTVLISVMTPNRLPVMNETIISVNIYGNDIHVDERNVKTKRGTAVFDIFYYRNQFTEGVRIDAALYVDNDIPHEIKLSHSLEPRMSGLDESLLLMPQDPILRSGSVAEIPVWTNKPVASELHLMTVSKGVITRTWDSFMESVQSSTYEDLYIYTLKFDVTCSLAPKFHLTAFYLTDGGIAIADSRELHVHKCLDHKVRVEFDGKESRPGDKVRLNVTAAPHSYVGITALDSGIYLEASECDPRLTAETILEAMAVYDTGADAAEATDNAYTDDPRHWWRSWWAAAPVPYFFKEPGIAVISNYLFNRANIRRVRRDLEGNVTTDSVMSSPVQYAPLKRIRSFIPDAWLWEEHEINESGLLVVERTVPDSVTTWVADAFALSDSAAFGVTESPARLVAFKPFFVSVDLPYSVVRGEEVVVVATVFNYYHDDLKVVVALDRKTLAFEFVGDADVAKQSLLVPGQDSRTARFKIIARKLRNIPIRITAHSALETDSRLKMLLVKPEGIPQREGKSLLIAEGTAKKVKLELPKRVVSGSATGVLSVSGDVISPAVNSLGSMLQLPWGCGEQNMINFAPAVLIKRYLTRVGQLSAELDAETTKVMELGYQRQLTYQRSNGSYASFEDPAAVSSTCLTAFVVRVLSQAMSQMYIDFDSITRSVCWLADMQRSDGSFVEPGHCSYLSCGQLNMSVTLTAYVLVTLAEVSPKLPSTLDCEYGNVSLSNISDASQQFLEISTETLANDYIRALTAYALALTDSNTVHSLLAQLEETASRGVRERHWECEGFCTGPLCTPGPGSVEATAYVLLAYSKLGRLADGVALHNWLVSRMDSRGAYRSTQDTVVALMALSEASALVPIENVSLNVTLHVPGHFSENVVVNGSNRLITHTFQVVVPSSIHVKAEGSGSALFQSSVFYNVPELHQEEAFDLDISVTGKFSVYPPARLTETPTPPESSPRPTQPVVNITVDDGGVDRDHSPVSHNFYEDGLDLTTCLRWLRSDRDSSMVIMEIGLLSGFTASKDSLEELVADNDIKLMRFEIESRTVVLYFDKVNYDSVACFNVSLVRTHCAINVQPAFVRSYSYYEPDLFATSWYTLPNEWSNTLESCQALGLSSTRMDRR